MAQVNIHYASMTVEHIDQKKAMTVGGLLVARYIMAYTTTNHNLRYCSKKQIIQ